MEITTARLADAPAILELQRLAYQSEAELYNDWSIPPLRETLAELQAEFACATLLKACIDGRLIGAVRGRLDTGTCHIGRLIVHPQWQGQGIGSALLRAIEAAFPAASAWALFTGSRSVANLRLYARHGYQTSHSVSVNPALTLVHLVKYSAA